MANRLRRTRENVAKPMHRVVEKVTYVVLGDLSWWRGRWDSKSFVNASRLCLEFVKFVEKCTRVSPVPDCSDHVIDLGAECLPCCFHMNAGIAYSILAVRGCCFCLYMNQQRMNKFVPQLFRPQVCAESGHELALEGC